MPVKFHPTRHQDADAVVAYPCPNSFVNGSHERSETAQNACFKLYREHWSIAKFLTRSNSFSHTPHVGFRAIQSVSPRSVLHISRLHISYNNTTRPRVYNPAHPSRYLRSSEQTCGMVESKGALASNGRSLRVGNPTEWLTHRI